MQEPMAVRVATTRRAPGSERWLPPAVIATTLVVVLPAVLVSLLVPSGSLALLALSLVLGVALSLAAASLGGAIWRRLPGPQDRVFADLMLWGWLRRSVAERPLAPAEKLLAADPAGAGWGRSGGPPGPRSAPAQTPRAPASRRCSTTAISWRGGTPPPRGARGASHATPSGRPRRWGCGPPTAPRSVPPPRRTTSAS